MATYYGYVQAVEDDARSTAELHKEVGAILERNQKLKAVSEGELVRYGLHAKKYWSVYRYESLVPMMNEDPDLIKDRYTYPVLLYRNSTSGNIIISAWRYNIAGSIVRIINASIRRNLIRVSFDVDKVIERFQEIENNGTEKKFFCTSLQLDLDSFGTKLESISLVGNDVIGAHFVGNFQPDEYSAKLIGIRWHESDMEAVRLQRGGGIQFYSDRLVDLERCLAYVQNINAMMKFI